ncbi:MAG TPA: rhomboid family intramembrane serine protease [Rugosimonospora sp.]|nr:rhomboid family intramembrane serine protease [Rugosimonospora sp.]
MTSVPPVGVPTCYRHSGRETYVTCTRCNRPICPDCMREASVGFQCPECVAEGRRTQRPVRTAFGGSAAGQLGYATISLVVVNILMLLISLASAKNAGNALAGGGFGGLLGGETPLMAKLAVQGQQLYDNGTAQPFGVANGEYYRLITSMFMHYGLLHLLMNMWALWILGRTMEAALGPVRFLALYLIAGLGGSVAAYLFQPDAPTAGASGAIFGLFSALFLVLRRLGRNASAVIPIIVINLIFTFSVPGISIAGHLGGFLTGGVVGAGMAYAPRANRTLIQVLICAGTVVLLAALTLWKTSVLKAS